MRKHFSVLAAALLLMGAGCFGSADTNVSVTQPEPTVVEENDDARQMPGCNYEDKNLCKFWSNWEAVADFTAVMTMTGKDGKKTSMTMEMSGDTRSHVSMNDGAANVMESINIDTTTYVKNPDGSWLKFFAGTPMMDAEQPSKGEALKFDLNDEDTSRTTFTAMGKEACGSLTCYKYEVIEAGASGKQYIWFDDKEFKLRKMRYEDAEVGTTEAVYSYGKVNITEPSPVIEYQMPSGNLQGDLDAMLQGR